MIDNSLTKLLKDIEPKVQNIEDNRVELKALESVCKTMEELMEVSVNSYDDVLNFYDQDFILRAIKIGNSDYKELIQKYDIAKYLLKSKDSELQELPQYQESLYFMDYLYQYLSGLNENIKKDFANKKEKLEIQELLNKYYRILTRDTFFIEDVDEFLNFVELNNLDNETKLALYKYISKVNIKQYTKSSEIKLDDDLTVEDIKEFIEDNKELLEYDYKEEYNCNLEKYLNDNKEISEDYFQNRKIYLIKQIQNYYDLKEYIEIINYYKEFIMIQDIQKEFEKQKETPKKILFVFRNDKSLVRNFLDNTELKYKNCILKNLLDIENEETLNVFKKKFEDMYIYVKEEFVVKTVYTYLDDGKVLILGVLDKDENLDDFLLKNKNLYKETLKNIETIDIVDDERELLLKNIKLEDLVLNIDLETLDVKMEGKYAR